MTRAASRAYRVALLGGALGLLGFSILQRARQGRGRPTGTPSSDLRKQAGWARGLVHFHTEFSDGWASVMRAAEIAVEQRYDFLIVTDHLADMKLKAKRSLPEYIAACDEASSKLGIPVLPGGEMEVNWNSAASADFSQAHTLALSIRALVAAGDLDWSSNGLAPFAHWVDSACDHGTVLAIQGKLRERDLPPVAAHQFQHDLLSAGQGEFSDYRYDLDLLRSSSYVDFFYSGAVELIHEPEDIALVLQYAATRDLLKAVHSGCDFHAGPETYPPMVHLTDPSPTARRAYQWVFKRLAALALRLKGEPETATFPYYAEEQLSHATYVHLGEQPCREESILEAFRDGRTCVTRGLAEFAALEPAPSFTHLYTAPVHLRLHLPVSCAVEKPRPLSVIVFRDGNVVRWEPYSIKVQAIDFGWTDPQPLPGKHVYQVYVPSKFLSSPILFAT